MLGPYRVYHVVGRILHSQYQIKLIFIIFTHNNIYYIMVVQSVYSGYTHLFFFVLLLFNLLYINFIGHIKVFEQRVYPFTRGGVLLLKCRFKWFPLLVFIQSINNNEFTCKYQGNLTFNALYDAMFGIMEISHSTQR